MVALIHIDIGGVKQVDTIMMKADVDEKQKKVRRADVRRKGGRRSPSNCESVCKSEFEGRDSATVSCSQRVVLIFRSLFDILAHTSCMLDTLMTLIAWA
jgi:hypothetical protein